MVSDDTLLRAVVVIVAVFFLVPLAMMVVMMPLMGPGHGWIGNGAVGILWFLPWIVAIVLLLGVGYALYALLGSGGGADPALEELRQAYARGDLTDEEFDRRRERLRREE